MRKLKEHWRLTYYRVLIEFMDSSLLLHGGFGNGKLPPISPIILPMEKAEALLPSGLGLDIDGETGDVVLDENEGKITPVTDGIQSKRQQGETPMVPAGSSVTGGRGKGKEKEKGEKQKEGAAAVQPTTGDSVAAKITPAVPNSPAAVESAAKPVSAPTVVMTTGKGKKGKKQQAVRPPVAISSPTVQEPATPTKVQNTLTVQKQQPPPPPPAPTLAASIKKQDVTVGASVPAIPTIENIPSAIVTPMAPPPPSAQPAPANKPPGFKTMRIVSSPTPTLSPASNNPVPPITPTPTAAKKTPVSNLNLNLHPGTPANRDDLFSDTASTTSSARAMSPTPSSLNSPRVDPMTRKPKSKSAIKRERQMAQREREVELAAAAAAVANKGGQQRKQQNKEKRREEEEDHAPVVARQTKMKDKKKKKNQGAGQVGDTASLATATGTPESSRPESPVPVSVTVPQTPRQQSQQQVLQTQHHAAAAATSPVEDAAEKPQITNLTAQQILQDLASSGDINFSELDMLKPIVGLSHKFDISPGEVRAYDRHINGKLTLNPLNGLGNAGVEQLRQPIVTGSNIILRGLTKEQEERFLMLEEKVLEGRKTSWRWTPPGKGIGGIAGETAGHGGRYGAEGELSDVSSWWKDTNRISARFGPGDRERLTSAIAAAVGLADQALSAQGFSASVGVEHGHHNHHHHTHGHSHQSGHHFHHHHHNHNNGHGHGHNVHGQFSGDEDVGEDISVLVGGENESRARCAGTTSTESRISFDEALNRLSSIFPQVLPPFTTGEYKVSVDFTGPCGGIGCQAARGDVEGLEHMGMGVEGEYEFVVGEGEALGGTITLSAGLAPPGAVGQRPEITISSSGVTAGAGKGKGKAKAKANGNGNHYPGHGTAGTASPIPVNSNTTTVNVPVPANLASTMNGVISGMMSGLGLPGFAAAAGGLGGLGGLGGAMMGMGMLGVPGLAGLAGLPTPVGMEGFRGVSGAQGVVGVSVEEAEKQLVAKRKETEGLERKLNQLLKRNRRLAGL
ncbi:hypothetical protein EV426DRAFT_133711 [Tirmania nivea]|nr:hypothetical protein EV426DRAFT_133711 [Tirmania nivea]